MDRVRKTAEANGEKSNGIKSKKRKVYLSFYSSSRYCAREAEYRKIIEELQREVRVRSGLEKEATQANMRMVEELNTKIKGR